MGGNCEEGEGADAAAALPHAVAPDGTPCVYSCGGAEMRRRRGCCVCAGGGARGSAKRGGGGTLRRAARFGESPCCAEHRRFHKHQVNWRGSVARRATFGHWRLAAEQRSLMRFCDYRRCLLKDVTRKTRAGETTGLRPATLRLGSNSFESPCGLAAFVVNSEPRA
jgi:hypothetical protein